MNNFFLSQAIFATEFLNCILLSFQMGSNFIHTVYMDYEKKYNLSWNFDEKEIVFETVVNTTGYVGFGLSPDGTMEDSDIVIGEVNDDHSSLEVSLLDYLFPLIVFLLSLIVAKGLTF